MGGWIDGWMEKAQNQEFNPENQVSHAGVRHVKAANADAGRSQCGGLGEQTGQVQTEALPVTDTYCHQRPPLVTWELLPCRDRFDFLVKLW